MLGQAEDVVDALAGQIEDGDDAPGGGDAEPADLDQRADQPKPAKVRVAVVGLVGVGPFACRQQPLP